MKLGNPAGIIDCATSGGDSGEILGWRITDRHHRHLPSRSEIGRRCPTCPTPRQGESGVDGYIVEFTNIWGASGEPWKGHNMSRICRLILIAYGILIISQLAELTDN